MLSPIGPTYFHVDRRLICAEPKVSHWLHLAKIAAPGIDDSALHPFALGERDHGASCWSPTLGERYDSEKMICIPPPLVGAELLGTAFAMSDEQLQTAVAIQVGYGRSGAEPIRLECGSWVNRCPTAIATAFE